MSHFDSKHTQALKRMPTRGSQLLPGGVYLCLTGEYAGASCVSSVTGRPDPKQIFLWIEVTTGAFQGKYESATEVHSDRSHDLDPRVLSYHLADEAVLESKWPPVGANTGAQLSYRGLRLEESDFTLAEESDLHDIVLNYATRCDRISVFGMSYETGDGIDNAHMNTEPNQDGGLVFYFDSANGGPVARWVFLKHQEPTLP